MNICVRNFNNLFNSDTSYKLVPAWGGPLLISEYVTLKYKDIISASYPSQHEFTKTLKFMTASQLYPVGLALGNEERMMVYGIVKSRLDPFLSIRDEVSNF